MQTTLQWSGKPIELVELLYALYETGCFSKLFLKTLFTIAGDVFGCEVRNHSNLFGTIKIRVKGDRTIFLDKLKKNLTAKMERADEKPSRK